MFWGLARRVPAQAFGGAKMAAIRLIAGLGNVGPEYAQTRHNMGFWVVDKIAQDAGASFKDDKKFFGSIAKARVGGLEVMLLKPSTMMNDSGRSVAAVARFYRFAPEEILVVHDELDLPPGVAKLKAEGGFGGHNGLNSIGSHLGAGAKFERLRIGVGHPGCKSKVVSWVLGKPSLDDRILIENAIDRALAVIPEVVAGRMSEAMQKLHSA